LIIPHPAMKHPEREAEAESLPEISHEERPVEVKAELERSVPAGLPADITPEEIAAITAAAAALNARVSEAATPVEMAVASPEAVIEHIAVPVVEAAIPTVEEETVADEPPATFASALQAEAVVATEV